MALIGIAAPGRLAQLVILFLFAGAGAQQKPANSQISPAQQEKSPPSRPVPVRTDLTHFNLERRPGPSTTHDQSSAGSRGGHSDTFLCAPNSGLASSTRPVFIWQAPSTAAQLHFSLATADTNVLYEADVSGTRLEYPETAPALTPGSSYLWTVSRPGVTSNPAYHEFSVQNQEARDETVEELAKVSPDPLVRAQLFLGKDVWYDAIAEIEQGLQRYPGRKDLMEQLQVLYRQITPGCTNRNL